MDSLSTALLRMHACLQAGFYRAITLPLMRIIKILIWDPTLEIGQHYWPGNTNRCYGLITSWDYHIQDLILSLTGTLEKDILISEIILTGIVPLLRWRSRDRYHHLCWV